MHQAVDAGDDILDVGGLVGVAYLPAVQNLTEEDEEEDLGESDRPDRLEGSAGADSAVRDQKNVPWEDDHDVAVVGRCESTHCTCLLACYRPPSR